MLNNKQKKHGSTELFSEFYVIPKKSENVKKSTSSEEKENHKSVKNSLYFSELKVKEKSKSSEKKAKSDKKHKSYRKENKSKSEKSEKSEDSNIEKIYQHYR